MIKFKKVLCSVIFLTSVIYVARTLDDLSRSSSSPIRTALQIDFLPSTNPLNHRIIPEKNLAFSRKLTELL
ncbi:uncharacterized protein METZ01_LOCUS360464 [marine metagenome]|uniref:Uncharacterized protein n=1 Tax=marine metagenome TaxID=408172 RepID=A0A382SCD0_9ZZZZ